MSKKIVVFGPDNSGKTTLVQNIHDALPYFNKSHSLGPVSVEEMLKYTEDNLNSEEDFIFDRFPMIEEATCGYVLRGLNKFENMIDKVLDCFERVDLFIYCDPGLAVIMNWGDREQMDGVKDNIGRLKMAYDGVYKTLLSIQCPVIRYNWKNDELDKIIERINSL